MRWLLKEMFFLYEIIFKQELSMFKFFRLIKVCRLLRVIKLKKIMNKLISVYFISEAILALVRFLRLSISMLFLAHWLACLWFAIGNAGGQDNWVFVSGMED
jgi:hyperpolarization activated cyclic nucleotide-gated potassium channel 2